MLRLQLYGMGLLVLAELYIIDPDNHHRDVLRQILEDPAWKCVKFAATGEFLDEYPGHLRGCVIVNVDPSLGDSAAGLKLAGTLQARNDDLPVILLTSAAYSSSSTSVIAAAIRGGAFDCLILPASPTQLRETVSQAIEEFDRRYQMRKIIMQLNQQKRHMADGQRLLVSWICENLPPAEVLQLLRNSNGHDSSKSNGNGVGHSQGEGDETWLSSASQEIQTLSPRIRQTLGMLLAGASEKQIALRMQISRHTVHGYVKTLHKRLEVSSRGELLAKCLGSFSEISDVVYEEHRIGEAETTR